MWKGVPVILGLVIICGFSASTCSAEIDLSKLDASLFREHDLFDIAHEFAVQFPTEVREMFQQLAGEVYGDKSLGDDMFDQFAIIDRLRNLTGISGQRNSTNCELCQLALAAFGSAPIFVENFDEIFMNVLISGCQRIIGAINAALNQLPITRVDIKADPLCNGTVILQVPQIRDVFQKGGINRIKTANEMCENLNICIPPTTVTASSRGTRPISSSPRVSDEYVADERPSDKQQSRILNKEDYITIAQLTDIHIEPDYAIGSPKDCGLPVCCVEKWTGNGMGKARSFGEYTCNIPQRTINQFLKKVGQLNPDVILFTGDIPPHSVWEETEESQYNCTDLLTESIRNMIPGRQVYPCIGNHETYPTNMFSVDKLQYTPGFLSKFNQSWHDIAGFESEQFTTIQDGGYYSKTLFDGKLRLIVFNSDYMYTLNWYNALNNYQAGGFRPPPPELSRTQKFLEDQLKTAKDNNQKVILMSHHPIGGSDSIVTQSRWYQSQVVKYSDIIVLQPTGHTHYDEFRMIYNSTDPVSVVLVSPSVTSYDTRNPSMRLYYLNKTDFSLVDYEQYFYSLGNSAFSAQANEAQDNAQAEAADNVDITDSIVLLYSAKSAYQMPDLSPQSWDDLTDRFDTDRDLLFKSLQYSDAAAKNRRICRKKCQHDYICRQRNADFDLYKECKDSFVDDRDSTNIPPEQGTDKMVTNIPTVDGKTEIVTNGPQDQDITITEKTSGGRSLSCCNSLVPVLLTSLCIVLGLM